MLTGREIRLLAFVLGAALAGFCVKEWREHALAAPAIEAAR